MTQTLMLHQKKKLCASTGVGKGTHGLKVVKTLLEDDENWKQIPSKDDYQYLGVFPKEQMQLFSRLHQARSKLFNRSSFSMARHSVVQR